jgi:hypothetical protein
MCILSFGPNAHFPAGRADMTDTLTFNVPTQVMPALAAPRPRRQRRRRRREVVLFDLSAVEQFLDWLERKGHGGCELLIVGKNFVVRWR